MTCEYCDTPYDDDADECPACAAEHARMCDYWFRVFRGETRVTEDDLGAYELGSAKRVALERELERQR